MNAARARVPSSPSTSPPATSYGPARRWKRPSPRALAERVHSNGGHPAPSSGRRPSSIPSATSLTPARARMFRGPPPIHPTPSSPTTSTQATSAGSSRRPSPTSGTMPVAGVAPTATGPANTTAPITTSALPPCSSSALMDPNLSSLARSQVSSGRSIRTMGSSSGQTRSAAARPMAAHTGASHSTVS